MELRCLHARWVFKPHSVYKAKKKQNCASKGVAWNGEVDGAFEQWDTSQKTTEEEGTNFPQEAAERRKEGKKLVIKERDRKRSLVALRGSF